VVSENSGTPKSSILIDLIGFSIVNHPFWGTPILGNTHFVEVKDAMLWLHVVLANSARPFDPTALGQWLNGLKALKR